MLAAEAGGELGGATPAHLNALRTYGREVGTAFQIVDDVLDFSGSADRTGKTAGSDMRHGLITLPLLHYAKLRPQDTDAQAVMRGAVMYVGLNPWDGIDQETIALPSALTPMPGHPESYRAKVGQRNLVFVPYYAVDTERTTTYFKTA